MKKYSVTWENAYDHARDINSNQIHVAFFITYKVALKHYNKLINQSHRNFRYIDLNIIYKSSNKSFTPIVEVELDKVITVHQVQSLLNETYKR